MRLGCVKYINALPFVLPFQQDVLFSRGFEIEWILDVPSALNTRLADGQLDGALTSSVEYLDGPYDLLPGFGIASESQVMSVNLYTSLPLHRLSGACIGVTSESKTSIALLKLLCRHHWKIEPLFAHGRADKAFLLIGDEALKNLTIKGFDTIDLAAAWYELTGLPFVFALFCLKDAAKKAPITDKLGAALAWSAKHRQLVEDRAIKQLPLPKELISRYFSLLRYKIEDKEMEGLNLFKKLKDEHV